MQNPLVKVINNTAVNKVVGSVCKFYVTHESAILTTGTIGFSAVGIWVTYKNAPEIQCVLMDARTALEQCNTKEERSDVYKLTLNSLIPLVAPILIFEAATITCSILNKKRTDKLEMKLAETAGALALAETAIAQYQLLEKRSTHSFRMIFIRT